MEQHTDRLTWSIILIGIGILLYAIFSPFFINVVHKPFSVAKQTPISISSSNVDNAHVTGAYGTSCRNNGDGSYSFTINDIAIADAGWGEGLAPDDSNNIGVVAKWHQGMMISYDVKTDGTNVASNININAYPVINGHTSYSTYWSKWGDDNDAAFNTDEWARTFNTQRIKPNVWVHQTVVWWNANSKNVNRYPLADGTRLAFRADSGDRGKTITIKNLKYTVIEKLSE